MDEFYYKPTEIDGLIEIAKLDPKLFTVPNNIQAGGRFEYSTPSLQSLFDYHRLERIMISGCMEWCWRDPNAILWHVDGLDDGYEDHIPATMIVGVCILPNNREDGGTQFSDGGDTIVKAKPWHLYWVRKDLKHHGAKTIEGVEHRYLLRWYFKR